MGSFNPESFYFPFKLVLLVGDLIALDLEGVDLLVLNNVQVLLHLQLSLQLSQVVSVVLLDGHDVLLVLKVRHCLLLQIH